MGIAKINNMHGKGLVSFFGILGYISCVFQWLWVLILYSSLLKYFVEIVGNENNIVDNPIIDIPPPAEIVEPSMFMIFVGVVVMMAAVALVIYSFMKMPSVITKTNKKIISQAVDFTAPVVSKIQHKPDTAKFRFEITPIIRVAIKILIVTLPVVLSALSGLLQEQFVDYRITLTICFGLAIISSLLFTLQYLIAYLMHLKKCDIL